MADNLKQLYFFFSFNIVNTKQWWTAQLTFFFSREHILTHIVHWLKKKRKKEKKRYCNSMDSNQTEAAVCQVSPAVHCTTTEIPRSGFPPSPSHNQVHITSIQYRQYSWARIGTDGAPKGLLIGCGRHSSHYYSAHLVLGSSLLNTKRKGHS